MLRISVMMLPIAAHHYHRAADDNRPLSIIVSYLEFESNFACSFRRSVSPSERLIRSTLASSTPFRQGGNFNDTQIV